MTGKVLSHPSFSAGVPRPTFDGGGSGGDDGGMEQRLRAIEDRLLTFENKADHFATKDDVRAVEVTIRTVEASLRASMNEQTWKVIGVMITWGSLAVAAAFAIAKYVH